MSAELDAAVHHAAKETMNFHILLAANGIRRGELEHLFIKPAGVAEAAASAEAALRRVVHQLAHERGIEHVVALSEADKTNLAAHAYELVMSAPIKAETTTRLTPLDLR
ncbi:hypothetical protein EDD29_0028 [Actinocorallia herbida]|uniref:Uncharacterized protein n=1 Tax=Actinocorallia herbida TaxID=58109 RepID=A0A3N1CPA0_9ACTN|nr:hypothetical protein [Actinocorallia herbida]ROO82548.1 hypothetical protein EDD29_0028 [Actinocorallia herbida]